MGTGSCDLGSADRLLLGFGRAAVKPNERRWSAVLRGQRLHAPIDRCRHHLRLCSTLQLWHAGGLMQGYPVEITKRSAADGSFGRTEPEDPCVFSGCAEIRIQLLELIQKSDR